MTSTTVPDVTSAPSPGLEERDSAETRTLPPYHVVLLNDDYHTYDYVIEMLMRLFGHPSILAYLMALEVDTTGRVIVFTTHLERAELERERIHAYGADRRIPRCKGSMSAIIEPAA